VLNIWLSQGAAAVVVGYAAVVELVDI